MEQRRVCVTGAGGYLASWVVKLLISKGYMVHGSVRDPGGFSAIFSSFDADERNAHLKKLDDASENLQLFKASLLDYNSLCAAIAGCSGVFHVASPCPLDHVELIEPAVTGTLNVLKACSAAGVKRAIVVSSIGAVALNPNWPKDKVMDEQCWSDEEYCRIVDWYCLSKTLAEKAALQYGEKSGLSVVTVCPSIIFGPLLQSTVNASSLFLLKILSGEQEMMDNKGRMFADVRDVAEAVIMGYEKPEASGRYICSPHMMWMSDLVAKLRSMYPNYDYPKNFKETNDEMILSSEKLRSLGWTYRPLEETLADTVKCFQEYGLLNKDAI
ncbi:hypothetical protein ACLOJK_015648 [Asimina triloba]